MSVTVPPLRTLAMEAAMVSWRPTVFKNKVYTAAAGLTKNFLDQVISGKEQRFVGADIFGCFQAGAINIRHQYLGGSRGLCRLQCQQADHAGSDDESRLAALHLRDTYCV